MQPNFFLPRQIIASKLRHLFNGDLLSNNTTQNQPQISRKPADFRQILQFTCAMQSILYCYPTPSLIFLKNRAYCLHTPTMQYFTGISRNTQSKSYMLSLTECAWGDRNNDSCTHPTMSIHGPLIDCDDCFFLSMGPWAHGSC